MSGKNIKGDVVVATKLMNLIVEHVDKLDGGSLSAESQLPRVPLVVTLYRILPPSMNPLQISLLLSRSDNARTFLGVQVTSRTRPTLLYLHKEG